MLVPCNGRDICQYVTLEHFYLHFHSGSERVWVCIPGAPLADDLIHHHFEPSEFVSAV